LTWTLATVRATLVPRWGKAPEFCDGVLGLAVGLRIAHHHVVALLTDQHLTHSVATHGRLDGVLYVGDINSETGGQPAIDGDFKIWLSEIAQQLDVMHACDARHNRGDFLALALESLQVVSEDLEGERTLGAGEGFADVVFDRL